MENSRTPSYYCKHFIASHYCLKIQPLDYAFLKWKSVLTVKKKKKEREKKYFLNEYFSHGKERVKRLKITFVPLSVRNRN